MRRSRWVAAIPFGAGQLQNGQAAVGYTQSALALPVLLVGLHVTLAALTWSGAVRLVCVSAAAAH